MSSEAWPRQDDQEDPLAQALASPDDTEYKRVIVEIRQLWNSGAVEFTIHAQEMMEERVVDANDIQHVIRFGKIVDHVRPEQSPHSVWRYTIRGKCVDGAKLDCVVDIDGGLIIVTVVTKR